MNKFYRIIRYEWPLHFILLFTNWLPDNIFFINLRGKLASPFFKKCGKNLGLGRNLSFVSSYKMEIGDNVYIAIGSWFNGDIIIESDVLIGPYCILATNTHTKENSISFRFGGNKEGKIIIKFGSWVAGQSMLVGNSELGIGSALAANSVLSKKTDDCELWGGVPAKLIKKI